MKKSQRLIGEEEKEDEEEEKQSRNEGREATDFIEGMRVGS